MREMNGMDPDEPLRDPNYLEELLLPMLWERDSRKNYIEMDQLDEFSK